MGDSTRAQLRARLDVEFNDRRFATTVVAQLNDDVVDAVASCCDGDIASSPFLSFRPPTMALDRTEAIMAFSYGYRLVDDASWPGTEIPPMDALLPGPINEQLASIAAALAAQHDLPVIAQWEIARLLDGTDVISIEPEIADDGTIEYLSTAGVVAAGHRLAAAAGIRSTTVCVVAHADHAPRCVATVHGSGSIAGVAAGISLPTDYDAESGQRWTRDRVTWVATDLFARTRLADSTDWNPPTSVTS